MSDVRERLARGERLLGLLLPAAGLPPTLLAGLDLVVVSGAVPAATPAGLAALGLPVAVLVDASGPAPDDALTVTREPGVPADVQLSGAGAARLVTSPAGARAAFADAATLVVYDGPAMVAVAFAGLADGRDLAAAPLGRAPLGREPLGREPLVLLAGMLGDERVWDEVCAGVADVALPWPARIDLDDSVVEMAASVLAAAPPRFALAGHSLGGIVALEVVRQAPERVSRLALLNTSARGPSEEQLASWSRTARRVDDGDFAAVADELAEATLGAAHRDAELVARNRRMADSVGADGLLRQLAAQATRPESRPGLGELALPVLVLSGDADTISPPALQAELAGLCRNAELVTLPGCGHMSPLEDPALVVAHLRAWLQRDR